jgi:hypothetical protein
MTFPNFGSPACLAKLTNGALGQVCVASITVFRGPTPHEVDKGVIPKGLMENRSTTGFEHAREVVGRLRVFYDVMLHTKPNHQVKTLVGIV